MDHSFIAAAALAVDIAVGDPARLPHPVSMMGEMIGRVERQLRQRGGSPWAEKMQGIALVLSVLAVVAGFSFLVLKLLYRVHPCVGHLAGIWLASTTIAAKGLGDAAKRVYVPLIRGNLPEARLQVGQIVGRDTQELSEAEVVRAAVETVAENIVDAVVSPLFYAVLGGAPLALLYRAANTMDSVVGHRSEKYRHFGWAAARLDDVLNVVPARLTGVLLWGVALTGRRWRASGALRAMIRDARKHPSPNSGIPEAAVAGALGVRLGGRNTYGGVVSERAGMGEATRELKPGDIMDAVRILRRTSFAAFLLLALWTALRCRF